VLEKEKK
jgi:hypothetical protein